MEGVKKLLLYIIFLIGLGGGFAVLWCFFGGSVYVKRGWQLWGFYVFLKMQCVGLWTVSQIICVVSYYVVSIILGYLWWGLVVSFVVLAVLLQKELTTKGKVKILEQYFETMLAFIVGGLVLFLSCYFLMFLLMQ